MRAVRADVAVGLDGKDFHDFELLKKEPYNYNTNIYTFKVPGQGKLPVASFLLAKGGKDKEGKDIVRPYTPITPLANGEVRLMVKTYPQGNLSQTIGNLKPGDKLPLKGPIPKIQYTANMKKEIGMLAGGTGITPMLQILEEILQNPADKTKVTLIFANVAERDILLKEKLEALQAKHANFKVHHVLEKPADSWKGHKGFVNKDIAKSLLPAPTTKDSIVLVCGPPGFMNAVSGDKAPDYTQGPLSGFLKDLGYTSEQVFKF